MLLKQTIYGVRKIVGGIILRDIALLIDDICRWQLVNLPFLDGSAVDPHVVGFGPFYGCEFVPSHGEDKVARHPMLY